MLIYLRINLIMNRLILIFVAALGFAVTCFSQAKNDSLNWGQVYVQDIVENFDAYVDEAWGDIEGGTPCVAFVCVGLRHHPTPDQNFSDIYAIVTEGPAEPAEPCHVQLECSLRERGFYGPCFNPNELKPGDVLFTEDVSPFMGELWPSHAYIFREWVESGSTDYAYIIDYHGDQVYRNMTVNGQYDKFQYYMRSPYMTNDTTVMLLAPVWDAKNIENHTHLVWKALKNASNYVVQVSANQDFINDVAEFNTADTTFELSNLQPNKAYYWRINSNNSTNWSSTWKFKTGNFTVFVDQKVFVNPEIYPNPAQNELWINRGDFHRLQIYNALGVLVKEYTLQHEKEQINMHESGVFEFIFYNDYKRFNNRVIID